MDRELYTTSTSSNLVDIIRLPLEEITSQNTDCSKAEVSPQPTLGTTAEIPSPTTDASTPGTPSTPAEILAAEVSSLPTGFPAVEVSSPTTNASTPGTPWPTEIPAAEVSSLTTDSYFTCNGKFYKKQTTSPRLEYLPKDSFAHLLSFCDVNDLDSLRKVNHALRRLSFSVVAYGDPVATLQDRPLTLGDEREFQVVRIPCQIIRDANGNLSPADAEFKRQLISTGTKDDGSPIVMRNIIFHRIRHITEDFFVYGESPFHQPVRRVEISNCVDFNVFKWLRVHSAKWASVPNLTKFTISHRLFPMRFHKSSFTNVPSAMFGYLFQFGKTLVTLDIVSPARVALLNRDRGATTTPLTFEESLFFSDCQILNVEVARLMGDVAEDVQDSSIEGFEKRATNEQHALLVELYKLWNPNKKLPPNADPLWILVCCLECRAWLPKCAFDKAKIKRFHKSGWAPTCNMCLMMNEMHRSPLEFFDHSSTYEDACRQMIHVWDHPPINQVAVGNWDTMAKSSARVASEPVPPVSLESTTAEFASAPSRRLVASRAIQPPPACALTDEEIEEFKKDLIDEHRGICPVSMSVIYDCTDKRCNLQRVCRKFNNERYPKCDHPACGRAHIHMTCPAESSGLECLRLKALPEQQPHVRSKAHKDSISLTEYASRVALAILIPAHRCRRYGCSQ